MPAAPEHITSTAPKRIYLDIGDQSALERVTSGFLRWDLLEGVTWSEDNATSHGVAYVRADLAAAPDLLAALQVVVADWTAQFERNGHLAPDWCKQARTAIAKATGENA